MSAGRHDPVIDEYAHGPQATTEATRRALELVAAGDPDVIVLVEGVSDQVAVETLARRREFDLELHGVVVVPVGGAHGLERQLRRLGAGPHARRFVGLFDVAEESWVLRALRRSGVASPTGRADLAASGFFVCEADLEDELIRAAGVDLIMEVIDAAGEARSLRTLQKQSHWRDQPVYAQLRRFFTSQSRRKLRYARLLVDAIPVASAPPPLAAVLDRAGS